MEPSFRMNSLLNGVEKQQPPQRQASRQSSSPSFHLLDESSELVMVADKVLLRKLDYHVIPPLFILNLLAFLDRVNIGNARIQGLEAELKMQGNEYNIALFVFFIPYVLFEVPSNYILKHVAPSTWLSGIMFLWGVATIGQGLVRNFEGLVAMRVVLGFFESGLFPGCVYLISMYYRRYELQWRMSIFFSATIIAGAFGGLFAFAVANLDGKAGYSSWRWIFIVEGLITCVVALISKFWLPDWPETASFLHEEEREALSRRLQRDEGVAEMDHLNRRSMRRILFDWKIYCGAIMYIGVIITGYGTSFFIPTIIKNLGFTATAAQVRSIPIFAAAAVISISTAWLTDRFQHRFGFILLGVAVATIGYIILLNTIHVRTGVQYMACFFITCGGYIAQPITIVWLSNNESGHYKRAFSTAFQIGFGNIGGIIASNIFLPNQAPQYTVGYGVGLGGVLLCGLASVVFYIGLKLENRKRERGGRDYRLHEDEFERENMGDDHPSFRFSF